MANTPKIGLKIPSTADNIAEQINIDTPNNLGIIDTEIDGVKTQLNALDAHTDENIMDEDNPHGIIYEEGTFTPDIYPEIGEFTNITYGSPSHLLYIRVGNQVSFVYVTLISGLDKGTASGMINIGGLPFTTKHSTAITVGRLRWFNNTYSTISGNISTNGYIILYTSDYGVATPTPLTVDELTTKSGAGSNQFQIYLSGTYFI